MDYKTRQEILEADYRQQYSEWIESLPGSQLAAVKELDAALLEAHTEKPSYSPDYSFVNNIEEDSSQLTFISGELFDEPKEQMEAINLEERVLLRESIVAMIMNLEAADDVGFAIGIACVALGVSDNSGNTIEYELAERYDKPVKTILQLAYYFLDDTNIANVSERAALRRLVHQLAQTGNPALSLDVLKIATRIASCGESQSEVARRHGVSRQAVHKRRKRLIGALGLRG